MNEFALLTYYNKYLKEIRNVSDSTVKHYQEALKYISRFLIQNKKINDSIFEIQDLRELEIIKKFLYSNAIFIDVDKRGHQMYSAGFNNYIKFASGQGFSSLHQQVKVLDIPVPVAPKQVSKKESWKRSNIMKLQTLEFSNYQCEVDNTHKTFTTRTTGQPYMEGHHAIPLKNQNKFSSSLDVYANIVCLCPICHRLLHYGIFSEKNMLLIKSILKGQIDWLPVGLKSVKMSL